MKGATRRVSNQQDLEPMSAGGAKFMFLPNNKLCRAGLKMATLRWVNAVFEDCRRLKR